MIINRRSFKVNLSSNWIGRALFGVVLTGLIAVSVLSYSDVFLQIEDGRQVILTYVVIAKLNKMAAVVDDVAGDVRNEIDQGSSATKAVQTIEAQLTAQAQELDDLIPDSLPHQANVTTLRQELKNSFVSLEDAAAKIPGNVPSDFDTTLLIEQQRISKAAKNIIGAMSTDENSLLLAHQTATSATEQKTLSTVSFVVVGSVVLLIFIFFKLERETAKHKRTATALSESEERAQSIIASLNEGVLLIDANGTVTVMNPSAERILTSVAKDGLNRIPFYQEDGTLLSEEDYPSVVALRTGKVHEKMILRIEQADGKQVWIETNTQPLFHSGKDIPYATLTSLSDVTEDLRFQQALAEARDHALEASRAKSAFLATMSHEIRTPMNGVIGMTELVLGTSLSNEQREMLEVIRTSANNLLAIINDILDFSKVEAGKLVVDNDEFQPLTLMESAADIVKPKVYEKKLSLMTFVDPAIPLSLLGDSGRLKQILINLLGNAVKFTETGNITVRASLETLTTAQATVRFSISDTGIGISETARQRLFQPFMQADDSMTRKYGGTGLGLAICARLVELMHGQIGVESVAGAGATFWFSIPFEISITRSDAQEPVQSPVDLHGLRVLVVDDNDASRDILTIYLSAWKSVSTSVPDGASALHELRRAEEVKQPYDVAILDMMMPNMNGHTLASAIKHDVLIAPTQLIALTAYQEGEYDALTHETNFRAYLTKPIKQPELLDTLRNLSLPVSHHDGFIPVLTTIPTLEPQVLLVEDNAINRKVASLQLQKLGLGVQVASNGREALEALAESSYVVVFMDCQMPEIDGFEATRRVRQLEAGSARHIPIIAMTANAMQGDREACLLAGMDDYIAKPINLPQLQSVLEKWLPVSHANLK